MRRSDHPILHDVRVHRAALCGGTHGNERTGVAVVRRRRFSSDQFTTGGPLPPASQPRTFELLPILTNPRAVELNRRYVDYDLNRCFAAGDLRQPDLAGYERQRAQVLNARLGPKGSDDPACQFIVDMHTSTARLGPTVIIREDESLARVVAACVHRDLPEVRIMSYTAGGASEAEDSPAPAAGGGPGSAVRGGDYPYLAEIAPHGIEIEIGPVPQGVMRADTIIWTERIIVSITSALEGWNDDIEMEVPEEITVFRYVGDSDFPRDADGEPTAMIHPDRQDRDFQPLFPGDPMYLHFDGSPIGYTGEPGLVPVFVNEAAYYEKRAALTLAREHRIRVV